MKKLFAVLLCVCVAAGTFAACSAQDGKKENTTTSVNTTAPAPTDDAKIAQQDAINLVQSYTAEELGLTEEQKQKCSFMVNGGAVEVEGKQYIQVIATVKNEQKNENGEVSYTFDNQGEYYIRFDGKEILSKNLETGEYTKMEMKAVPTTTAAQTTEKETTTKKK